METWVSGLSSRKKLKELRTIAIIPALHEGESIGTLIYRLKKAYPHIEVLIINGGSCDHAEENARKMGSQVISLAENPGVGEAMQTGYAYAYEHGFDIVLQMDADGQYRPEELFKVLEPLVTGEADMVVGSRFIAKTGHRQASSRRIGIYILSEMVSLIAKQPIKDVTSGFRAVNRKVIELFADDYSTDYPEVNSLLLVKKHDLKIKEVPVEMNARKPGHSSISYFKSLYYMLKVTLTLWKRA